MSGATLRKVLWTDLIGSAAVCVALFLAAGPITRSMGIDTWVAVAGGIVLIPWLVLVGTTVRSRPANRRLLGAMVFGNLASAVAGAVLAVRFPFALSTNGRWELGVFALALAAMGGLELAGLRSLAGDSSHAAVA